MSRKKKTDYRWVEEEFRRQANADGILGDPNGEPAYGYCRVSSSGQAEEGRSGLPRQIEHIAEKAYQESLSITWDMFYFDDSTGFTFEDRQNLSLLLAETGTNPKSDRLVMEYPDRLSRDHTWRYGYLREQFNESGVEFVYWKGYTSEVERAVIGSISQEGMRNELDRMHEGILHKARSGRVTARVPAYGYQLVDSMGRPRTNPQSQWRKETYYAISSEENQVMVRIYEALAYHGATLRELANVLNEEGVPPPKTSAEWSAPLISSLVKNPVYKGDFIAHRWYYEKRRSDRSDKPTLRKLERPEEEWIRVKVPPTVSEETWKLANQAIQKNQRVATRNLHYDALLANFLRCATCGCAYIFASTEVCRNGHTWLKTRYACSSRSATKRMREIKSCHQSQISAQRLDSIVWDIISRILFQPTLITEAMERYYSEQELNSIQKQIDYLDQRIEECNREDSKLYKAYLAEVFDEQEYRAKRKGLKERKAEIEEEKEKLQAVTVSREDFEAKKQKVLALATQVNAGAEKLNLTFAEKRHLVKLLVDEVQLDINNDHLTIIGAFQGTYALNDGKFVSIPLGRNLP